MQRRQFLSASLTAAAAGAAATNLRADESADGSAADSSDSSGKTFQLNYGPHEGQFKNLGGKSILDQIAFAASEGFRSWEDNTATRRSTEEQEAIGQALYYAEQTGKRARVVLFCDDSDDRALCLRHRLRFEGTVAFHDLPIELVPMDGDTIAAACGVR